MPCLIADASNEDVKISEGASSRVGPTKTKDAACKCCVQLLSLLRKSLGKSNNAILRLFQPIRLQHLRDITGLLSLLVEIYPILIV